MGVSGLLGMCNKVDTAKVDIDEVDVATSRP
jgi:hypothetical protein